MTGGNSLVCPPKSNRIALCTMIEAARVAISAALSRPGFSRIGLIKASWMTSPIRAAPPTATANVTGTGRPSVPSTP